MKNKQLLLTAILIALLLQYTSFSNAQAVKKMLLLLLLKG